MAKGRKVRASRAAQGYVEFSHFPPAVHFDLIRKQAVVIPALSREFFDSSEISESVNFCVMEAIKLCRLDTPIIFIEARINLSRFVVTGCAAKKIGRAVQQECRDRDRHSFPTRRSSDLLRHGSDKTLQVGYANHFYRSAHKFEQICRHRLRRQNVGYSNFSQPQSHLSFCVLLQYLVERRRVVTQLGKLD